MMCMIALLFLSTSRHFFCQCCFVCLYLFVLWHSSSYAMTVLWLKQLKMLKICICNVQCKGQRHPSICVTHNKTAQQPYCDCLLDLDVTWCRCMTSLIAKASLCEISWSFFFCRWAILSFMRHMKPHGLLKRAGDKSYKWNENDRI